MKKKLQEIFKNFFYWFFKKIYGPIKIDNKSNNFTVFKIESNELKNFYNQNYKIYYVPKGRIYTDNIEHVGIIDNNHLCDEVSYQQIKGELKDISFNICIKKGTPRLKKYFKGRTLNLTQGASGNSNYAHWLFDMLPKIRIYQEKYNLKDLSNIYVNKLNEFQKNSFELLDLGNIKIIDSNKFRHIQSDEIIATNFSRAITVQMLIEQVTQVKPNDIILITAATGGVGRLFSQWAKSKGACVIGSVGNEAKISLAHSIRLDLKFLFLFLKVKSDHFSRFYGHFSDFSPVACGDTLKSSR